MNKQIFSIRGPMVCGPFEVESGVYDVYTEVNSDRRWLVGRETNAGEHIYCEGPENSRGFGGAVLKFQIDNGQSLELKGPWHSNSDALFEATGVDVRDRYYSQGIVAKKRTYSGTVDEYIYEDVLHYDEAQVLGSFDRVDQIAQDLADKLQVTLYYAKKSSGGGSAGAIHPQERIEEVSPLKVMKSAAGWYIGRSHNDKECGPLPYSRESDYFRSKEAAEKALANNDWEEA